MKERRFEFQIWFIPDHRKFKLYPIDIVVFVLKGELPVSGLSCNKLQLNDDKSEFLIIASRHQMSKIQCHSMSYW